METLDQEKFDTLKELAELQTSISTGRAELKKLEETTQEYMVVREGEAEGRVLKVLEKSREALDEATDNHKELKSYNSELQAFAIELKATATAVTALFGDFGEKMDQADKNMETKHSAVSDILTEIKIERVQVTEDRKQLKRERAEVAEATKLLKDRRAVLQRGFDELERLKGKKE